MHLVFVEEREVDGMEFIQCMTLMTIIFYSSSIDIVFFSYKLYEGRTMLCKRKILENIYFNTSILVFQQTPQPG
ncbi:hypothetical protein K1719_008816 [Acacia pycnantha]|nr:hypothetical protein K1719_008816 [Acacia pycnantha]